MKKILFRKLLLDYLTFFLIALISTGTVIWVFQAVNFLDIMIEDGRDYLVYLRFSLLNYPKIVSGDINDQNKKRFDAFFDDNIILGYAIEKTNLRKFILRLIVIYKERLDDLERLL